MWKKSRRLFQQAGQENRKILKQKPRNNKSIFKGSYQGRVEPYYLGNIHPDSTERGINDLNENVSTIIVFNILIPRKD